MYKIFLFLVTGHSLRTIIVSKILIMEVFPSKKEQYVCKSTYTGVEISVSEAKDVISKFSDDNGLVNLDLDVDCGIARVCLNNPRTKNALNGKNILNTSIILYTSKYFMKRRGRS